MTLAGLIIFLLIVGILLYMFPLEERIKKLIIGAVLIIALLWLASALGWIATPAFK